MTSHDNVTDIDCLYNEFLDKIANPNDYHVQMASWCYLNAPKLFEEIATLRKQLENAREALRRLAEGNLGPNAWQADYAKIKEVAAEALKGQPC